MKIILGIISWALIALFVAACNHAAHRKGKEYDEKYLNE